jgi:hypothetical protein
LSYRNNPPRRPHFATNSRHSHRPITQRRERAQKSEGVAAEEELARALGVVGEDLLVGIAERGQGSQCRDAHLLRSADDNVQIWLSGRERCEETLAAGMREEHELTDAAEGTQRTSDDWNQSLQHEDALHGWPP